MSDAYLRDNGTGSASRAIAAPDMQIKIDEAVCCLTAAVDHLLSPIVEPSA